MASLAALKGSENSREGTRPLWAMLNSPRSVSEHAETQRWVIFALTRPLFFWNCGRGGGRMGGRSSKTKPAKGQPDTVVESFTPPDGGDDAASASGKRTPVSRKSSQRRLVKEIWNSNPVEAAAAGSSPQPSPTKRQGLHISSEEESDAERKSKGAGEEEEQEAAEGVARARVRAEGQHGQAERGAGGQEAASRRLPWASAALRADQGGVFNARRGIQERRDAIPVTR
jgi:hypothetical protein